MAPRAKNPWKAARPRPARLQRGFLLGTTDAEDVEGVTVRTPARGISNAIGRSVDIMMGQPQSMVKPRNSYESVAT